MLPRHGDNGGLRLGIRRDRNKKRALRKNKTERKLLEKKKKLARRKLQAAAVAAQLEPWGD